MPVAALSGCSGPNDSPEQDAVMSISSCTARGDDGQENVRQRVRHVCKRIRRETCIRTTSESSTGPGNGHSRRFPCRTGIKAYMRIILTTRPSAAERWAWTQGARQTICIRKVPMVSGNAPSASITLYHLLSKVTFRMPAAVTAVRVADYSYSASYSLLTGSLEIKTRKKGTIILPGTGSLLLYPGDSPAMHVALVAGGHPYDFVMPAAAFRSGKEYVYTLKTAGNGVEIEDITITGWQPGGNYEGTITEKRTRKAMKNENLYFIRPAGGGSSGRGTIHQK